MILKIMVLCLALANVVFFLWVHGVAQAPDPAGTAPVATLRLISEVPATARTAAGASSAAAGASIGAAGASIAATGVPNAATGAAAAAVGTSGEGGAAPAGSNRCTSVGPFRDVEEAARAAGTLRTGGYDPRQRVVEGEVWAGLWVYVAAPPNPSSTAQLLAKLKAAGIDEAMEMPGPGDRSVISLGLFSEPKAAQGRVAQARTQGLEPVLADRKRPANVYWIDVDLKPTDGPLNPANLPGEAGRISRLETKACPTAPPS
jgi:hypothetical protein